MKPNLNYNDFFNEDTGQEPGEIIKINDSLQYCILFALILIKMKRNKTYFKEFTTCSHPKLR